MIFVIHVDLCIACIDQCDSRAVGPCVVAHILCQPERCNHRPMRHCARGAIGPEHRSVCRTRQPVRNVCPLVCRACRPVRRTRRLERRSSTCALCASHSPVCALRPFFASHIPSSASRASCCVSTAPTFTWLASSHYMLKWIIITAVICILMAVVCALMDIILDYEQI